MGIILGLLGAFTIIRVVIHSLYVNDVLNNCTDIKAYVIENNDELTLIAQRLLDCYNSREGRYG